MYHVVQMEVVETTCHVPQLRYLTLEREGDGGNRSTYLQANTIYARVLSHILGNSTILCQTTSNLERLRYQAGYPEERDDVRVLQPPPHNDFSEKVYDPGASASVASDK